MIPSRNSAIHALFGILSQE